MDIEPLVESITKEDGKKLTAYWYKTKGEVKIRRMLIICHGFNSNCKEGIVPEICKSLHEIYGYDVVTFNFTGCGDDKEKQEDSSFREQYYDLRAVLNHFSKKKYDSEEGCSFKSVIGHSTGGTVAILAAAYDDVKRKSDDDEHKEEDKKRIESIVLIAPRIYPSKSTMARKIEKKYCMSVKEAVKHSEDEDSEIKFPVDLKIGKNLHSFSKKYIEELANLDVVSALKRVECPILVLHGTKDKIVKIEEGKTVEMECKKENATFFPIIDANHFLSCDENPKRYKNPGKDEHSDENKDQDSHGSKDLKEALKIISRWLKIKTESAEPSEKVQLLSEARQDCRHSNNLFESRYRNSLGKRILFWPTFKKKVLSVFVAISLFTIFFLPFIDLFGDLPPEMLLPITGHQSPRTVSCLVEGCSEISKLDMNSVTGSDDLRKAGGGQGQIALWWAVLALISALTLSYVQFINRLRGPLIGSKKRRWNFNEEKFQRNILWNMTLMSWAMGFMFITICSIALGILCSYTRLSCPPKYLSGVILYSFVTSTLLRVWLLFDSHWEHLFIHWRPRKFSSRDEKTKEFQKKQSTFTD